MSGLGPRPETRYTERAHLGLVGPYLPLADRHLINLRDDHWTPLQARTAIKVQLEASLHVPLDLLAEPALAEPIAHLETDDLVRCLGEVLIHRNICRFVRPIKDVSLHDVLRRVPHFRLALLLARDEFLVQCGSSADSQVGNMMLHCIDRRSTHRFLGPMVQCVPRIIPFNL